MIGGFFCGCGGDKVEGSIQNVENYGIINKYEVLIACAQIHIIWFLLFIVYLALVVFLHFSEAPYILRGCAQMTSCYFGPF